MSSSQPPLLPNATRDLARFAAETRDSEIPFAVVERVKLSFIDGLGVCLHGSTLPWTRKVSEVVQEEEGKGVASLWGRLLSITDERRIGQQYCRPCVRNG